MTHLRPPSLDTPEFNQLMQHMAKHHGASRFAIFATRTNPDDAIQVADGLDDGFHALVWWNEVLSDTRRTREHSSADTALAFLNRDDIDRYRLVWVDSPPDTTEYPDDFDEDDGPTLAA